MIKVFNKSENIFNFAEATAFAIETVISGHFDREKLISKNKGGDLLFEY